MNLSRKFILYTLYIFMAFAVASCQTSKTSSSKKSKAKTTQTSKSKSKTKNNTKTKPQPQASSKAPSSSKTPVKGKDIEQKLRISIPAKDPNISLYTEAAQWIGTPYKYGGMSKKGTDCSGLTFQIYKTVYKKSLHRSSSEMAKYDVKDIPKTSLQPGDLIFFATSSNKNTITHVGVYLKDNCFIHASSKAGVVVNNLNEDYYRKTYKKCGRVK